MVSVAKALGTVIGAVIGLVVTFGVFGSIFGFNSFFSMIIGFFFVSGFGFVGYLLGSFAGSSDHEDQVVELNDYEKYELQKVASRGKNTTSIVALIFPPAGYYLAGKTGIALFCLLTAHFGTLAHIVAPFHTRRIVKEARSKLDRASSAE